jgi:hypothetical protein
MIYEDFVSILSPREVSVCPAFRLFLLSKLECNFSLNCKKVTDFPVPSRDVTNQGLPGREKFLVSDIPAGDGKIVNLFFTV